MHETEQSKSKESDATDWLWTAPTSQPRQRPATFHAGLSYYLGQDFPYLQSWELSSHSQPPSTDDRVSGHQTSDQDLYPTSTVDSSFWNQKSCEDSFELQTLDSEMSIDQVYSTDEPIPVLDLNYPEGNPEIDSLKFGGNIDPRRMSGSSFTVSTTGGFSDMASYEDFSAALSEAPSFSSDYPPPSNRTSLMSSTHLSPVASPRMTPQGRSELVRTQSRGRASPSPRPGVRSAPYSIEGAGKSNKRWSTGSYGPSISRRPPPPFVFQAGEAPVMPHPEQQSFFMGGMPAYPRNNMYMPSPLPSQMPPQISHQLPSHGPPVPSQRRETPIFETPAPLMSHGLFRMLQSNADSSSLHGHYHDLSDPPDLFSSLQEEQLPPPPEDMNPSDPDLVPHEQELRFEGDLYTPKWVRGHGNKREGWCGICKPGRWLVLKNSAFWYDKSFTHGISAASGNPFQEPQDTRRMDGNPDVWEGLCGSCNEWIALVSSKKKGTTWFRHAYKCHSHPKIKDGAKRRRESSNARGTTASASVTKPKLESQPPVTPQMPTSSIPMNTPGSVSSMHYTSHMQQVTPVPPPQLPRQISRLPSNFMGSNEQYPNMI